LLRICNDFILTGVKVSYSLKAWALKAALLSAIAGASNIALAGPEFLQMQAANVSNSDPVYYSVGELLDGRSYYGPTSFEVEGSASYAGWISEQKRQTTVLNYSGSSHASANVVEIAASLQLQNPFFNTQYNVPRYRREDGWTVTEPNGIVEMYNSSAQIQYKDTVRFDGATDLTKVRITFNLEGSVTGPGCVGAALWHGHLPDGPEWGYNIYQDLYSGCGASDLIDQAGLDGRFSQTSTTLDIDLDDGELWLMLTAWAGITLKLPDGYESDSIDGRANLGLSVLDIVGFNDAGERVAVYSVTDSDGQQIWRADGAYQPVPEPAALALFGAGLGALGLMQGRRKRAAR